MQNFLEHEVDLKTMSPLALAFMGDGVYEMFVREYLVTKGNSTVKRLHKLKVDFVCCSFQAQVSNEKLMPIFTEEEKAVFMRGRNAKVGHVPKNASVADYHNATAFECIFGYLYLQKKIDRLKEFFEIITKFLEEQQKL